MNASCSCEQSYIVRNEHINGGGRLFGGQLLMWIDDIAGVTARTSREVTVKTYCETLDGERTLINVAHLVEVALNKDGKACTVPPFEPQTDEEKAEWEAGRQRHEARKHRLSE